MTLKMSLLFSTNHYLRIPRSAILATLPWFKQITLKETPLFSKKWESSVSKDQLSKSCLSSNLGEKHPGRQPRTGFLHLHLLNIPRPTSLTIKGKGKTRAKKLWELEGPTPPKKLKLKGGLSSPGACKRGRPTRQKKGVSTKWHP